MEYKNAVLQNRSPRSIEDIPSIESGIFRKYRVVHVPDKIGHSIANTIFATSIRNTLYRPEIRGAETQENRESLLE